MAFFLIRFKSRGVLWFYFGARDAGLECSPPRHPTRMSSHFVETRSRGYGSRIFAFAHFEPHIGSPRFDMPFMAYLSLGFKSWEVLWFYFGAQSGTWTRIPWGRGFWDLRVYHSTIWANYIVLIPISVYPTRVSHRCTDARSREYGSDLVALLLVSAHLPFHHLGKFERNSGKLRISVSESIFSQSLTS